MIKDLKKDRCRLLLQGHYWGHLAFTGHNSPYVLPITYYYDKGNNCIISTSAEGHKIDCLRENKLVSLNVSKIDSINNWSSVLIHGEYEELKGIDAKYQLHQFLEGIKKIVGANGNSDLKFIGDFSSSIKPDAIAVVYRIKINEITGKYRTPDLDRTGK
ncbi:MAG TPA: pyridoxamine 5'-phosphate oxidase family protein [Arenibacter sp.]|nr:pyridoxamine 5'-phosphate oxidase family protein [Arenibacter sp.]